jgi:cellobiose-specific phosphotransferase system component IIC
MKILENLNGTTKAIIGIAVVIGIAWQFDGHYAKASDVETLQQGVGTIVSVMKVNAITKKTVLELKKANGGLTAAETVELQGIYEILKTLGR